MKVLEIKIDSMPDYEFRTKSISPVDLLAITTQTDFEKFAQTKALYAFALENMEVKIGEKWFPVKLPGREVYMPTDIEENLTALNELIAKFLDEVVAKTFTKSSE